MVSHTNAVLEITGMLSNLHWSRIVECQQYRPAIFFNLLAGIVFECLQTLKMWLLLFVFGAVSKLTNMTIIFKAKEHVARSRVFNSFCTTTEVSGIEEENISSFEYTHTILIYIHCRLCILQSNSVTFTLQYIWNELPFICTPGSSGTPSTFSFKLNL